MAEKKARFTLVDLLIILIIAAVVAVAVIKILPSKVGQKTEKISFTVLLTQKEDGFIDAMSVGDEVSISNKEKDTARITKLSKEDSEVMTFDSIEGEYKTEKLNDKQDVYVTMEADASVTDSLITAGTTPIKVGLEMPVRGKGYASTGYVIDIEE